MNNKLWAVALVCGLIIPPAYSQGEKMLHPDFPIVEGPYQMTNEWSVSLPGMFNRRTEDGNLVIWRPGFTVWVAVWGNDKGQTKDARLNRIKSDISPEAFDLEEFTGASVLRLSYRLKEGADQGSVPAFYCFAVGESGHVQMAVYLDKESDIKVAQAILRSLNEHDAS